MRKLLSDLLVLKRFGLAHRDSCLGAAERTVNFVWANIVVTSGHKVLTLGSCFEQVWPTRTLPCNEL